MMNRGTAETDLCWSWGDHAHPCCRNLSPSAGEPTILVEPVTRQSSTIVPHAIGAHDGPGEILIILDHDGERTHLHPSNQTTTSKRAHLEVLIGQSMAVSVVSGMIRLWQQRTVFATSARAPMSSAGPSSMKPSPPWARFAGWTGSVTPRSQCICSPVCNARSRIGCPTRSLTLAIRITRGPRSVTYSG